MKIKNYVSRDPEWNALQNICGDEAHCHYLQNEVSYYLKNNPDPQAYRSIDHREILPDGTPERSLRVVTHARQQEFDRRLDGLGPVTVACRHLSMNTV